MSFLFAKDLNIQDFLALPEKHTWPEDALLMTFSPARHCFERFVYDESFLSGTDQGRIFSPQGEMRWRRYGHKMRVVWLGNAAFPEGLTDYSDKLKNLQQEEKEFILWGVRTDTENEWIEQQVPHRFVYPIKGKEFFQGRAALVTERWTDESGIPVFGRYCTVREIRNREENHATG